jgi:hypothetical protein
MNRIFLFFFAILSILSLVSTAPAMAADGPPPQHGMNGMASPPPGGKPGDMPPPPPGGGEASVTLKGAYVLDGGTVFLSEKAFGSAREDTSAIWVKNGGRLTLSNPTVTTSGNTSSNDGSSFFGLNAAVLASRGGRIAMERGSVTSTGSGANGLFATGQGALIEASELQIRATGNGGHGAMTSKGGAISLKDSAIFTTDAHAAAIATDRGGGTIVAVNCKLVTMGEGSPALYSTGVLTGDGLYGDAGISEAIVIEGRNTVTLRDSTMIGRKNGAMIYQSFSGDAQGTGGSLSMTGGTFVAEKGAVIYATNGEAHVTLDKVAVRADSGVLARASADRWGTPGKNGGHLFLTAVREELLGDITADDVSTIAVKLTHGTTLGGTVTRASLTLDATSVWNVTGDSSLVGLTIKGAAPFKKIRSKGFTVTYDASLPANAWLGGKSHTLKGGGVLSPQ